MGDSGEFFIPIHINLLMEGEKYEDDINWNIFNTEMTPEIFAEILVNDEKISNRFITPIAMQIRKEIHYFVFDLLKNISNTFDKYNQEKYLNEDNHNKNTRYSEDNKKGVVTFLFDAKLTKLLGKKTKKMLNNNNDVEILPEFLRNKRKCENLREILENEGNRKSNKKINSSKTKENKYNTFTDHDKQDKQSTTIDENEE